MVTTLKQIKSFLKGRYLAAALLILISLAGIANHELWTPDEPREAAIALAMARDGGIIIPKLAEVPFVEKPPLAYVVSSTSLKLFGSMMGQAAALRFSSAVLGLLTLGMTFLLARRTAGLKVAALSVAALAVMPGFVNVTHRLLVDNTLMFCVTAAVYGLSEAYLTPRRYFLFFAGLAAGGAFLAKGLIGPLIIGIAWLGFMLYFYRSRKAALLPVRISPSWLTWHFLALSLALLVAGLWVWQFRLQGSPELWQAWFWDNHFGRFTGKARELGHIRTQYYYLAPLILGCLPWTPVWLDCLKQKYRQLISLRFTNSINVAWSVSLTWALGGLLLLTLSSTKRDIYLSVLFPAYAVITGLLLERPLSNRVNFWFKLWSGAMFCLLALMPAVPVFFCAMKCQSPPAALSRLVIGILLLGAAMLYRRREKSEIPRFLTTTALVYLSALTILPPGIDYFKNQKPAFQALAAKLPAEDRSKTGSWQFDETTTAGFYYYCNLVFPVISDIDELSQILARQHSSLSGVMTVRKKFPPKKVQLPEWEIRAAYKTAGGGSNRELLYVLGAQPAKIETELPANHLAPSQTQD